MDPPGAPTSSATRYNETSLFSSTPQRSWYDELQKKRPRSQKHRSPGAPPPTSHTLRHAAEFELLVRESETVGSNTRPREGGFWDERRSVPVPELLEGQLKHREMGQLGTKSRTSRRSVSTALAVGTF
ncbi:uncharacterized protein ACO6RY_02945 [Pungitius sinensis]